MASVESFENLEIWEQARAITNKVYDLSETGRFSRDFGLRDQMRRAALSVMSNIAEGFESPTQKSFINYLGHAKASAGELRSQIYVAVDRKYLSEEEFQELKQELSQCSRRIVGLIRYLDSKPNSRRVREDGAFYEL
jgi:four helix bundle protein